MTTALESTSFRLPFRWPPKRSHQIYSLFAIVGVLLAAALFSVAWRAWVQARYKQQIFAPQQVPPTRVAIVFGAWVYRNDVLSAMLRDRVDTAIALYKAGKVQKLLVSGDNRFVDYNEPGAMMNYAIAHGVAPNDIQPDYGGRRTYDTCYRAQAIFQVSEAILVTQAFHLPRALFLCDQLGIKIAGVAADHQPYSRGALVWSESRELPALVAALVDILRHAPPPVMGAPIPVR